MGIIEGALAVLLGIIIGRVMPARRKTPRLPPSPKPICGCGHHLAYHDKKTGQCSNYQPGVVHAETGNKVQCKCKQYSGPLPLEQLVPTDISD